METLYTHGEWTVKKGREAEFVAAWSDFARWTVDSVEGSSWAKLLRDRDEPRRFVSFGPWRDEAAVAAWRAHPDFQARVAAIQELVDAFVPRTLTVAAEIGSPTPEA